LGVHTFFTRCPGCSARSPFRSTWCKPQSLVMFSFLQASPQPEKEPENTPDVQKDTSTDISTTSSFGFMNQELGEEDPHKGSSFSFMQCDAEPVAATTGFSFLSNATGADDTTVAVASSFSFMTGDNLEASIPALTADHYKDLTTLLSLDHPVGQANEIVDLKLNKTSVKTVRRTLCILLIYLTPHTISHIFVR